MDKRTFYLEALNNNACWHTNWTINAYSVTKPNIKEETTDLYPFKIIKKEDGVYFINSSNDLELLEEATINEPIYNPREVITITPDECRFVKEETETTYGQLLINAILDYSFKGRIPFINKERVDAGYIESLFKDNISKEPEDGVRDPNAFYYDDIEKYYEAIFMFAEFALIFTPGDTEKGLRKIPGLEEKRRELFDRYKDELHKPEVEALVVGELVKLDKEYRKGDASERLFTKSKDLEVVRKKMYLTMGKEGGLVHDPNSKPIEGGLDEGWPLERFEDIVNNIREGTFSRGAETAKGGELAKWTLRAFVNSSVVEEDCGTTLGLNITVDDENKNSLIGLYLMGKEEVLITKEMLTSLMGKKITVRNPIYCKTNGSNFCKKCVGIKQANDPTSIGVNVSEIANSYMDVSMKAFHGKALKATKYNMMDELS